MLSEKTWDAGAVIRLFAAVIGTVCFGIFTTSLIEHFRLGGSEEHRRFVELLVMGISFQGGILIWIWVFLREVNFSWNEAFGFSAAPRNRAIVLGVAAGVLFLPLAWGGQAVFAILLRLVHITPDPQQLVEELSKSGSPLMEKVYLGVLAVFVAPVAEESLFRGILYPTIKRLGYPKLALWGTAALFGAFHVNLVTFVPLTLFGVVLILSYEATGNLLTPIIAHSVFNSVNFLILIFQDEISRLLNLK